MYVFNWKFGGMDFEVPEYISRNYDAKELKGLVRNITKNYGKDRLTLPAKDLSGSSAHSYDAVKDMEDIAFIEDAKKIIFIGKSSAPSFDYVCVNGDRYFHNGCRNLKVLAKDADIFQRGEWDKSRKLVELKHSDELVDEKCFFIDNDGRVGFLVTTEMFRGTHNRGVYEIFDLDNESGEKVRQEKIDLILNGIYSQPKVRCDDGRFVIGNFPAASGGTHIYGGIFAPTETSVDLVYDWKTKDFMEMNKSTKTDFTRIIV